MGLLKDSEIGWFPCAAHNMQLCVNAAINKCGRVKQIMDRCQELSHYFRSSNILKERLSSAQKIDDPSAKALVPLTICATRWNSKYLLADRVVALLPAMTATVEKLRSPLASTEEKNLLKKLPTMLDEDDISILKEVLALLGSAKTFTERASSDAMPFISQLYPTIWEMRERIASQTTTFPAVEEFQRIFNDQMTKRWTIESMPEGVLIATFLNPALAAHLFFNEELECD
ncbi:hypothetical protein BGX20_005640, partial [Mortierella sp. AD010]